MVFSISNTSKVTLFNLNTSLDCRGMKSRVILKKVKNQLKFRTRMLWNSTLAYWVDENVIAVLFKHYFI